MTTASLFTRADGSFHFSRWGRPIVPVIFGIDDAHLPVFKGAIEAMVMLAQAQMAGTDPELGANFMLSFGTEWDELAQVPQLGRLIPDLPDLAERLTAAQANQYRTFRFDDAGAIRACYAFVRVDAHLADVPVATLALNQALQMILLWSDTAFAAAPALARAPGGEAVLRAEVAEVVRAAYDPVLPAMSRDPSLALRLAARIQHGKGQAPAASAREAQDQ